MVVGVSGTSRNLFEVKQKIQKCVFDVMVLVVVACAFINIFVSYSDQNPSSTPSCPFSILDLYCGSSV